MTRLSSLAEESYRLRRLRRRLHGARPEPPATLPERPVGVKLELTHACNLRCDFCYTDSPRHTLARTVDLPDDAWRAVTDEALELGVVEAVVTGGEPLLRAPLALELIDRLSAAGVGVTLNTNGWFLDDAVADRLAAVRGITVNVSLDGATPELHDAARGVPGSWRRAVAAIARLRSRDVPVTVVHVVTPLNERWVGQLIEHVWLLGVDVARLTPVVPIGAAARRRGWTVDRPALRRTVERAAAGLGDGFSVRFQSGMPAILPADGGRPPAALLVRPGGAVTVDQLHPFRFGSIDDGLEACWERVRDGWGTAQIEAWGREISSVRSLARAPVVPYADDEVPFGAALPSARSPAADAEVRLPRRAAESNRRAPAPGDLEAARDQVTALGLAKRYRVAPLRWSGTAGGERVVRLTERGRMCRLNAGAGAVLDLIDGRTVGETAETIAARHPGVARERITLDTLRATRSLAARGILHAAPVP